jgi:hypothetical protein
MEWVKEKIERFYYEAPQYTETDHVIVWKLRSDGMAFYQAGKAENMRRLDIIPGGRVAHRFDGWLNDERWKALKFTEAQFDEIVFNHMKYHHGAEITIDDL